MKCSLQLQVHFVQNGFFVLSVKLKPINFLNCSTLTQSCSLQYLLDFGFLENKECALYILPTIFSFSTPLYFSYALAKLELSKYAIVVVSQ